MSTSRLDRLKAAAASGKLAATIEEKVDEVVAKNARQEADEKITGPLNERYNGDDKDERARIIFGLDDKGQLGAYVHLDFSTSAVAVPDDVHEVGPELDRFVEQMRFAHMAGFHGWLARMSKVCPLCGGEVKQSSPPIVFLTVDEQSKFICADCSWTPQIPQLTHSLGGPNHG